MPVFEIAPQGFLVIGPENEVFEIRIAERGIRLERGTVKACGLQHHAMMEQRVSKPEVLHSLASIVLKHCGEQADGFSGAGLGEYPGRKCQFDINARNFINFPNDVCSLNERSLIVKQMGESLAGFPVAWVFLQDFAEFLFLGGIGARSHIL